MDSTNSPIKFDTIKLITNSRYITGQNISLFQSNVDIATGELISIAYHSHHHPDITPYKLYIYANYRSQRLSIEFSSKILLADYPLLISIQTFRQCLANIEAFGICSLDIDGIVKDCYFNKLHIAKDIDLQLTPAILDRLNQCTGDYQRCKWRRYDTAILFSRNVQAADCRESITIYDKATEITRYPNKAFLNKTGDTSSILDYFTNKTRLEVKLENKRKIQKELGIADTDYHSVMGCHKNIVLTQFDKIFGSDSPAVCEMKINNIVDYRLWCIIRYHQFDLQSIEQEIKDMRLYEDKTKGTMGKQMKKIKTMMQAYLNQNYAADTVIDRIREQLR